MKNETTFYRISPEKENGTKNSYDFQNGITNKLMEKYRHKVIVLESEYKNYNNSQKKVV